MIGFSSFLWVSHGHGLLDRRTDHPHFTRRLRSGWGERRLAEALPHIRIRP